MERTHYTPQPVTHSRTWRCIAQVLIAALLLGATLLSPSDTPGRLSPAYALAPAAGSGPRQPQMAPLRLETSPQAALAAQGPGAGPRLPLVDLSHLAQDLDGANMAQELPDVFDWRNRNGQSYVTPAKDQRGCAACYAFAFLGQLESKLLIDGAGSYDLSENQAKECNWTATSRFEYPPGSTWGSCNGGNSFMLANLFSRSGTVLESCDPFVAGDVGCKGTCPYQQTVLDWRLITAGPAPPSQVLKRYLYEHGPLAVSMFIDLDGGFHPDYDGSFTLDYEVAPDRANHTVLLVGWSNQLPPARGESRPAEGWIVKNNWGPDWGDQGFFYARYGALNLGAISSFVQDWQDYDPGGQLLHYDEGGWWHSWGCEDPTAWALSTFTAPAEASIERVEFWTTDATTAVDVFLYRDFDGDALSGLLASKVGSQYAEAGYHSVHLDEPVRVARGQQVVAVVKATNKSYGFPIAGDPHGKLEPGRTYLSCEGHWWHDMGADYGADMGIRLRTAPVPSAASAPTPQVTSITPGGGNNDGVLHISRLAGTNFLPGAVVSLSKAGEQDIQATEVVVASDSRITCEIDLSGAAPGFWGVRVNHPGGPAGVLDSAFEITSSAKTWNGQASTDWHAPENWTPPGVPSRLENVTVPDTLNDPIISRENAAAQNLIVESGAVLDLTTKNLQVEGAVSNNGVLKQTKRVTGGGTTSFLHLCNQAGDRCAYYGLDLSNARAAAAAPPQDQPTQDLTDLAAAWYNDGQEGHENAPGGPDPADYGSSRPAPASPDNPLTLQTKAARPLPDMAATEASGSMVTIAVAGNQQCEWRATAVRRCYDIRSSAPLRATLRFYFRDAERNGHERDGMKAYRFGSGWAEVPGRYERGATDLAEGQYVEVHDADLNAQFSLDRPSKTIGAIYLPLAMHHWP